MQVSKRAVLIGKSTGGGGYINDFFSLPFDLGVSISVGRTFDPRTGNDWQGVGVQPDLEVEVNHALSTALSRYTKLSGKLEELTVEQREVYLQMQNYANAWYGADSKMMAQVLSKKYVGVNRSQKGKGSEKITAEQLIQQTARGDGVRKNKIYYNRIIRNIRVEDNKAYVNLILRETAHEVELLKSQGQWLIVKNVSVNKVRG